MMWNNHMKGKARAMCGLPCVWSPCPENGEKEFTRTGRRRRARYTTVAELRVGTRNEIPIEIVQAFFKSCSIISDDNDNLCTSKHTLITNGSTCVAHNLAIVFCDEEDGMTVMNR